MKRLATISLLLCLFLPMLGMISWLSYEKHQVKRKIKRQIIAGIDKSELIQLRFSTAEIKTKLHWKHSKEFEYDGQMYDVVIKEKLSDTIVYWCWWDYEETRLNKKLDALVALSMDKLPQKKDQQTFIDHILDHLFISSQVTGINYKLSKENISPVNRYSFFYSPVSNKPPIPPPEYIHI